ncbi:nuclear transport factor 2 family protein [Streptomyces sp. NPDC051773]|uniref:nuclear transport factor 2 family protein n=1 Tax=Streptomyces sp. NPDC051773 TaxID=3156682 RepID=UPI00343FAB86
MTAKRRTADSIGATEERLTVISTTGRNRTRSRIGARMTVPAQTARRFLTALEQRKADEVRAMIASDVVARFPVASGLSPARLDGRDALMTHLKRAMATFDTLTYRVHTLVADARTAVVEFSGQGTIQGRDDYTNDYLMIFSFDEAGRIRELAEYYNPIRTATYFGFVEVTPLVPDVTITL